MRTTTITSEYGYEHEVELSVVDETPHAKFIEEDRLFYVESRGGDDYAEHEIYEQIDEHEIRRRGAFETFDETPDLEIAEIAARRVADMIDRED